MSGSSSNPDHDRLREQIIGLNDRSLRKSYFPQLQLQIEELKDAKVSLEQKSAALLNILEDLESSRALAEESERRFKTLFDQISDGIVVADPETKRFRLGNQSILRMLGYSLEEFQQLSVTDIHPAEEMPRLIDHFEQMIRHQLPPLEIFTVKRRDGSVFFAEINTQFVELDNQPCVLGVFRDITERRQAEAALQREQEFNRALLENVVDGVVACDAEGKLVLFNRTAREWHGLDPMKIPMEQWAEHYSLFQFDGRTLLPPEEIPLARAFRGETVVNARMAIRPAGQPVRYILASGMPFFDREGRKLGAMAVMHDVTEQQRVQQERETMIEFLQLVNASTGSRELIHVALVFFQQKSGCEAVGIRLREGEDYPYFETRGFAREFIQLENKLCVRDKNGELIRDSLGDPILECMCGNVICGRFNPADPFFTPHGSFWSNSTTGLLAATSEKDRQRLRIRCNREGYESVALIPIYSGKERFGLLQLNDRREGMFSVETIGLWERLVDHLAVALGKFRAEESLRESETRFRTLVDQAADAFYLHDGTGKILDVNRHACENLGYSKEELLKLNVLDLEIGLDRVAVQAAWERVQQGQEATATGYHRRKDGSTFPVEIRVGGFELGGQHLFLGLVRDITERKRAEESLRESELNLKIAQKTARLGSWIYELSGRLSWSEELYRVYGVSPDTFLPTIDSFISLIHPEDRPSMQEWIRACAAGGKPGELVFRVIFPDGSVHFISGRGGLTCDANGKPIHLSGTALDITERKQAEEELHRYADELKAINDELMRFNRAATGRELRMIELKQEINDLCKQSSQPARYNLEFTKSEPVDRPVVGPESKEDPN